MKGFWLDNDPEVDTRELCAWGGIDQRGLVDHPAVGTAFFIATGLCFQAWPCVRRGLQRRTGRGPCLT